MDFLKAEQLTSSKWRVLAIPFGGEFKGAKDADGEFFTPNTDIKPDWFDRRPVIWHHGKDAQLKDSTLGVEDDLEIGEEGWWATLWLDRGARYRAQVESLLRSGKAYGSSGAISHLVDIDRKTGEIKVWPHAEQTLTTAPINFLSRVVPAKAADAFKAAGIELAPDQAAILTDLDSPTADLPADLSTGGDPSEASLGDLSTGGDAAAIQRLAMDPDRERVNRLFVAAFGDSRIRDLTKNL